MGCSFVQGGTRGGCQERHSDIFDAQYGADQENKEFVGTKTEKGKISHYTVVDGAGKTISWKQDYNVKHAMAVCEAVDASRQ